MNRIRGVLSVRNGSSLAEKLREATGEGVRRKAVERTNAVETDASGEPFRETWLMPKRKLRGQLQIEQATGRAVVEQRSRMDIHERLGVRRPRAEEMSSDQDWTNVWPAARSFNASVVPLPIRMSYRRHPDKRAPFKKYVRRKTHLLHKFVFEFREIWNLSRSPTFCISRPLPLRSIVWPSKVFQFFYRNCSIVIAEFMTPYPPELLADPSLADKELPIKVTCSSYVHQGTNIRDMRSRVITMRVNVDALNLDSRAKEKLLRLAGRRYDEANNLLTIVTDRCHTRKQNLDYAYYLLTKIEKWEELKLRQDDVKISFSGSQGEKQLVDLLAKTINNPAFVSCCFLTIPNLFELQKTPLKDLGDKPTAEQILQHEKVKDFAETWYKYRNTPETEDVTREYGRKMRELLGLAKKSADTTQPQSSSSSS
ncbi:hypothetical protein WR25_24134 isoform A [Diploscapter pachys]|uniref:Small ribosomal subunit protein mS35 mitochondrial conserved domain-containing protein n=1 Tax=Diploscapter pachys TaxID=2018661 RepID=A0A2A2K1T4_9BILA|nr:hypothetical protein WR25_24134 isoform A [Diploscapter pachys]